MGLVRVRVRVMVKVRVKARFRVQKYLGFDPGRHSEPFIWETYPKFNNKFGPFGGLFWVNLLYQNSVSEDQHPSPIMTMIFHIKIKRLSFLGILI